MIDYEEHLENFIRNLRSGNFYDAHEDLEHLWFPRRFDESGEAKLLKGFINASVSFELYKKGKEEPSKKVWENYLKYRDLIYTLNSPYNKLYCRIIKEIEKIKKSFMKI